MNLLPSACFLPQLTVSDWSVGSAVSNLRRPDTLASAAACALRGGSATSEVVPEIADLATGAYDWCINLGAPSALVAGAVVATIYEAMSSGNLDLDPDDTKWVALGKKLTRMLLLTAFAFETISIFVTTVTGTMLMSRPPHSMVNLASVTTDTTPLSFLSDNFEFEYLTSRITFLQGLLNWLAAIGMAHVIPNGESVATRKMNMFIASMLFTAIFVMLAFYNAHMDFHRKSEESIYMNRFPANISLSLSPAFSSNCSQLLWDVVPLDPRYLVAFFLEMATSSTFDHSGPSDVFICILGLSCIIGRAKRNRRQSP
jgi:uncharacterized membrane protein